jgi:hypothetical protein
MNNTTKKINWLKSVGYPLKANETGWEATNTTEGVQLIMTNAMMQAETKHGNHAFYNWEELSLDRFKAVCAGMGMLSLRDTAETLRELYGDAFMKYRTPVLS